MSINLTCWVFTFNNLCKIKRKKRKKKKKNNRSYLIYELHNFFIVSKAVLQVFSKEEEEIGERLDIDCISLEMSPTKLIKHKVINQ